MSPLLGQQAIPGFPSPSEILHLVPPQPGDPISCFVHGLFLVRRGDLNRGIQLLDRCQFPEAIMATVEASLGRSSGLDHSECVSRLKQLITMGVEQAKWLYATRFLGRASGVPDITAELMELDRLFTPADMPSTRASLSKRLWATTARKRKEANRLRVRAQKARSEANRLQLLYESKTTDSMLKRAQKAEEKALELERKADRADQEVERNISLVGEVDDSIKQARARAALKAREDAVAARVRAKELRDEAKQAEKRARDEAKQAEKRVRDEAKRERDAANPAKRAKK